jgi:adenylosuccinate lyase
MAFIIVEFDQLRSCIQTSEIPARTETETETPMAEPLSVAASILAVIQVSAAVVRSLGDLKDIPQDVRRLQKEIDTLHSVLLPVLERLNTPEEEHPAAVQLLGAQGPLEEFRTLLEHLKKKLAPVAGLNKARRVVTWQFQKGEIRNILGTIERQKSLFVLALQSETQCAPLKDP